MEEKDKLLDTMFKKIGKVISDEIDRYETNRIKEESEMCPDNPKSVERIAEDAVDVICRYIGTENGLLFEKLDKIIELLESIRANQYLGTKPWTAPVTIEPWTPNPYPYPYGPYVPYVTHCDENKNPVGTTYCVSADDSTSMSIPELLEELIR